ncbi:MAG: ribose-5-phosphate isomerase RpiA [Myxococcota bacterium]|nr:ribose-5-phosphate isomerase RpiA [Myxococcota bacterium]
MSGSDEAPVASAEAALRFVKPGQTLGLGTGRAAEAFVRALGAQVAEGLDVRGVPTSVRTEALARELGIPLLTLAEAGQLDVTFDGADEVDPHLDVIKGYGGALVREKIVAASSNELVILVGEEKLVACLGARGKLPVEVAAFGEALATRKLAELGCPSTRRESKPGEAYITDNGHLILDCAVSDIQDPADLEGQILGIPGVLGTGLFIAMADAVIVQKGHDVEVRSRS